jgi:predicted TIM-barrel fold metal-dependent hydrolase
MLRVRIGKCAVAELLVRLLTHYSVMFGTDHPFFPPLDGDEQQWLSVTSNAAAIRSALGTDSKTAADIMGDNAARVLRLQV